MSASGLRRLSTMDDDRLQKKVKNDGRTDLFLSSSNKPVCRLLHD